MVDDSENVVDSSSELEMPDPDPPTLIDNGRLVVADRWEETKFEQAEYGPDQREGIDATFESSTGTIRVMPVEFERQGDAETVIGVTSDIRRRIGSSEIDAKADFGPQTAFAVHLSYETFASRETDFYTFASDAADALAVACWLTNTEAAGATGDLEEIVNNHKGETAAYGKMGSDEDHLDGAFVDEPRRCLVTGSPTHSHEVLIPYRYAPLLDGYPSTYQDVPAIPETVAGFRASVSHSAWTEHSLSEDIFHEPIERTAAGEYELAEDVIEIVDEFPAEAVALTALGESV